MHNHVSCSFIFHKAHFSSSYFYVVPAGKAWDRSARSRGATHRGSHDMIDEVIGRFNVYSRSNGSFWGLQCKCIHQYIQQYLTYNTRAYFRAATSWDSGPAQRHGRKFTFDFQVRRIGCITLHLHIHKCDVCNMCIYIYISIHILWYIHVHTVYPNVDGKTTKNRNGSKIWWRR